MTQMQLAQFIHAMPVQARIEIETHYQCIVKRRDPDIMLGQHPHVIFQILSNFEDRIILEQRLQSRQCLLQADLLWRLAEHVAAGVAERNIAGLVGAGGKAHADDPGGDAFETVGLQIHRTDTLFTRPRDPLVECRHRLHTFIF